MTLPLSSEGGRQLRREHLTDRLVGSGPHLARVGVQSSKGLISILVVLHPLGEEWSLRFWMRAPCWVSGSGSVVLHEVYAVD